MTTSDPHVIRRQNLDSLLESRGWTNEVAPALTKRIAALEAEILAAGEHELNDEQTRTARRERELLIWMRDTPGRLIESLEASARLGAKKRDGAVQ